MPAWLQIGVSLAVLAAISPLIAWLAKRHGARVRGGLGLAMIMLGVGEAMDPPSKHMIEASEGEEKASPAPGEPPA
jgi:hypothetical protein